MELLGRRRLGLSCTAAAAAAALGMLSRGTREEPLQATRISFADLQSASMPRPLSEDSPDLEAWLTSTTDGLIQQRTACGRQGITPPTIVINSSMLPGAHGSRRRGLFYIGNAPLPARSTAALFRCLLVRLHHHLPQPPPPPPRLFS